MCRLAIAIVLWLGLNGASSAQVSCQKIGQQTYCSNGQVLQRFGNTTYDGQGHAWQQSGDRTYSSDGTTYQRSGNQILDNKGNSLQRFGNQSKRSVRMERFTRNPAMARTSRSNSQIKRPAHGSFCYPIQGEIFCDPAPTKPTPQAGNPQQGGGAASETQPAQPTQRRVSPKAIVGARVVELSPCRPARSDPFRKSTAR